MTDTQGQVGYHYGVMRRSYVDYRVGSNERRVLVEDVVKAAADATGMDPHEVFRRTRDRTCDRIRAAIYVVCIDHTLLPLCRIAEYLDRDHTSLLKTSIRLRARMEVSESARALVEAIRSRVVGSGPVVDIDSRMARQIDAFQKRKAQRISHARIVRLAEQENARLAKSAIVAATPPAPDDVTRLRRLGWSVRSIARYTGRDPKVVATMVGSVIGRHA